MQRSWIHTIAGAALITLGSIVGGCASSDADSGKSGDMRSRQDAALKDPMNWKPDTQQDISGGGLLELDRDGLKRDWDRLINP